MWLYVPPTPSPSAPGSADSTLASVWRCRSLARFATWRGKPLPPRLWSRRWKQGGFIRLLSGLTCAPSTLDAGVESLIASLRATRARATALPESGSASLTIAGCLIAPSTSSTPAGLLVSSARTCRGTPMDNLPSQSRHWSDWAAALRSEYSARPKPATPCGASDCSSSLTENWPSPMAGAAGTENYNAAGNSDFSRKAVEQAETLLNWAAPQARDHFPAHSPERIAAMKALGHGMRNLNDEAANWRSPSDLSKRGGSQPAEKRQAGGHTVNLEDQAEHWNGPQALWTAPKASDPEHSGPNMRYSNGGMPLPSQVAQWAAPCAQNYKGSSEGSITRQDGKSRMDLLHYQAEQGFDLHFLPPSSPAQPTAAGSTCSIASPNSSPPSVRRKLNPIFVEALMRWPTGLSGFERQETVLIPSLLPTLFCTCERGSEYERNQNLPALRDGNAAPTEDAPNTLGEAEVVRSDLHECGPRSEGDGLREVRGSIPSSVHQEQGAQVLLDPVCEHGATDPRAVSEGEGRAEISDGSPDRDGADDRQAAPDFGDCASRGWQQAEQLSVEPFDHHERRALARAHERQPTCAPLSALDVWWLLMPSYLSALVSASEPDTQQMDLFA